MKALLMQLLSTCTEMVKDRRSKVSPLQLSSDSFISENRQFTSPLPVCSICLFFLQFLKVLQDFLTVLFTGREAKNNKNKTVQHIFHDLRDGAACQFHTDTDGCNVLFPRPQKKMEREHRELLSKLKFRGRNATKLHFNSKSYGHLPASPGMPLNHSFPGVAHKDAQ